MLIVSCKNEAIDGHKKGVIFRAKTFPNISFHVNHAAEFTEVITERQFCSL